MTEDIECSISNFEEVYTFYRELEYKHELATKLHEAQLIIDHRMRSSAQVLSVLKQGQFAALTRELKRANPEPNKPIGHEKNFHNKEKQNDK